MTEFIDRSRAGVRGVWLSATENPAPKSTWESAVRRGLLIPALVLIGLLTDNLTGFSLAAIGALNIGLIDSAVPRRTLFAALASTTVFMTLLAFITSLLAGHWLILVVLVPVAFIAGALSSSGFAVATTGFLSLLGVIVFSNDPRGLDGALNLALWVLLGSVIQVASAMIAWRYEREASLRRAMGVVVDKMRALTLSGTVTPQALQGAASAELSAEVALRSARFERSTHAQYASLLAELGWARLGLVEWLNSNARSEQERQAVAAVLEHVDADIRRVIHPLRDSWPPALADPPDQSSAALFAQLRVLDDAARKVTLPIEKLPDSGDEASYSIVGRAGLGRRLSQDWDAVRSVVSPGSKTFAHGVRLAISIAVAEGIVLAFTIDRGYWIPLTVAVVLRADIGSTVTRGVLRIVGTIASVTLVGLLMYFAGNPPWMIVVLLAIFAPLTMRWFTGNYALSALAITATVLLLVESGTLSLETVELRLINTLLGAAIAFVGFVVWPAWKSDQVTALVQKAITTQQVWTDTVLKALATDERADPASVREIGKQARNAVIEARPAAVAALIEPHKAGVDPRAALHIVDACSEAGIATMALEVTLRMQRDSIETAAVAQRVNADFEHATVRVSGSAEENAAETAKPAAAAMHRDEIPPTGDTVIDRALMVLVSASDSVASAAHDV